MELTLESIAAKLDTLTRTVEAMAERFDARLAGDAARFEQIDARFEQIDGRFEAMEDRIREYILAEAEKTRRHFDIVAEQIKSERSLVLDSGTAAVTELGRLRASNAADHRVFEKGLADHEARLRRLEKRGRRSD